jgi:hypothetical protein
VEIRVLFGACLKASLLRGFRRSRATALGVENIRGNASRHAWIMVVGFLAWALSLGAAAVATRDRTTTTVRWALGLAAAGLLLLTVFHTQTSAGHLPPGVARTVGGRLHDLGAGVTSVALLGVSAGDDADP